MRVILSMNLCYKINYFVKLRKMFVTIKKEFYLKISLSKNKIKGTNLNSCQNWKNL